MTAYKKIQTKKNKNNTRCNNKSRTRTTNRKKTSNHFRHVGASKSSVKRLTRTLKRTQYKEVSPAFFL